MTMFFVPLVRVRELLKCAAYASVFLIFVASAQDRLLFPEAQLALSFEAYEDLVEARVRQQGPNRRIQTAINQVNQSIRRSILEWDEVERDIDAGYVFRDWVNNLDPPDAIDRLEARLENERRETRQREREQRERERTLARERREREEASAREQRARIYEAMRQGEREPRVQFVVEEDAVLDEYFASLPDEFLMGLLREYRSGISDLLMELVRERWDSGYTMNNAFLEALGLPPSCDSISSARAIRRVLEAELEVGSEEVAEISCNGRAQAYVFRSRYDGDQPGINDWTASIENEDGQLANIWFGGGYGSKPLFPEPPPPLEEPLAFVEQGLPDDAVDWQFILAIGNRGEGAFNSLVSQIRDELGETCDTIAGAKIIVERDTYNLTELRCNRNRFTYEFTSRRANANSEWTTEVERIR